MPPRDLVLTDRDRLLLQALAQQRVAVLAQAAHWLGVSERTAAARVRRLRSAGLVESRRLFASGSPMLRITAGGLRAVGSRLGRPGQKLDEYRHDVGLGWIWTAARAGAFGEMDQIRSEREMRSHDARLERMAPGDRLLASDDQLLGVGFGAYGPDGRPQRHYPDLLLHGRGGQRIGVELELSSKGRARLDRVMASYASDHRIDGVLYLVPDARLAGQVRAAAHRAGIGEVVYIREITGGRIGGLVPARGSTRTHAARRPERIPVAQR